MLGQLRQATTGQLMHVQLRQSQPVEEEFQEEELPPMRASHINPLTGEDELAEAAAVVSNARGKIDVEPELRSEPLRKRRSNSDGVDPADPSSWGKVARNAACPCGSGKKFKHCHGKLD